MPPAEAEAAKSAELARIQAAVALTDEENEEKDRLMDDGMLRSNWLIGVYRILWNIFRL